MKKRLGRAAERMLSGLLICCMLLALLPVGAQAASFAGGSGTAEDPYQIATAAQLCAVNEDPAAHYVLTKDVDMQYCYDFEPIGNPAVGAFTGTFDGANHAVRNLTLDLPGEKYVALFGYLEGTVESVKLENASINGGRYAAGIAAYADDDSIIRSCSTSGSIQATGSVISTFGAGIAAYSSGLVQNCRNAAYIEVIKTSDVSRYRGGVIGYYAGTAEITDCENRGELGRRDSNKTNLCDAGGIVGYVDGTLRIRNCANWGEAAAGIVLSCDGIYAENCTNYGPAGFAGIVYCVDGKAEIVGCTNNGEVKTQIHGVRSAGIASAVKSGTIRDCVNSGDVYAIGGAAGICGDGIAIQNCVNTGDVSVGAALGVGAGIAYDSGNRIGCVNTGRAKYSFGHNDSVVSSCSIGGSANNSKNNGCFFGGSWYASEADFTNCYGVGYFSSPEYSRVGGWWTGLLYPECSKQESFLGWDFENTWKIDPKVNNGMPLPKNCPARLLLSHGLCYLEPGETVQLTAYYDGEVTKNVTFESLNRTIAGVDGSGKITAIVSGEACIAARMPDGTRANCWVYVKEKSEGITLPETVEIELNKSKQLSVSGSASEQVRWKSDASGIASVNISTGEVSGKKLGTAQITAETSITGQKAVCTVKVVLPSAITDITLSDCTLFVGQEKQLTPTVTPASNTDTLRWTSSDETVATVASDGTAKALKPGKTLITVTSGSGKSAQATLTVEQPAAAVTLDRTSLTMELGLTEQLHASLTPADSTDTITWTSSSTSVVTVDASGVLTANRAGEARISAKASNGAEAVCFVTVTAKRVLPEQITLGAETLRLKIGEKQQLTATILPAGADQSIQWSTDNETVASVSETGVVTANAAGTAVLRAETVNGLYAACEVRVSAVSSASFVLSAPKASAGQTVDVTVSLERNPGLAGFNMQVVYDPDVLTPTAVRTGSLLSVGSLTSSLEDETASGLRVTWASGEDVTGDGTAFTVTFRVADAASGTTQLALSYSAADVCNAEKEEVTFRTAPLTLELLGSLSGDVNLDGKVSMKDIVLLAQHLNGLVVLSDQQRQAADLYPDGAVNVKDLVALEQLLTDRTDTQSESALLAALQAPAPASFALQSLAALNETTGCIVRLPEDLTARAGDEITVPVRLSGTASLAAFRYVINYDKAAAEVLSITKGEALTAGTFNTNLGAQKGDDLVVTWYHTAGLPLEGTLFYIRFRMKTDVLAGAHVIGLDYEQDDICDSTLKTVPVEAEDGALNVPLEASMQTPECTSTGDAMEVTLHLTSNAAPDMTGQLILAGYRNGQLVHIELRTARLNEKIQRFTVRFADGCDTVQLYLLDPDGTLRPLTQSQIIKP